MLFPGWRSQTRGTLPTEPFLLSRAARRLLRLSQIWSEPSRFLPPAQCRRSSTGRTPARFQDLNKVRRNRWAKDLENQKGVSAPQTQADQDTVFFTTRYSKGKNILFYALGSVPTATVGLLEEVTLVVLTGRRSRGPLFSALPLPELPPTPSSASHARAGTFHVNFLEEIPLWWYQPFSAPSTITFSAPCHNTQAARSALQQHTAAGSSWQTERSHHVLPSL